ncbi:tetratricopeptide repeat protein [Candidatus Saccharibacteria bacterium]|nr:tetratricopeptide repeat protein [Candidatus Saccharibacteria bacterium]
MLSSALMLCFALFVALFVSTYSREEREVEEPSKNPQMKKLWNVAQTAMRERKPLRAEKALLTILKFDEKNAAAYNRLGILYAREKYFKEAIDCFEIAQSLDNNASSLHNVGLIYYETGKYEQAATAFQQAIDLEGDQPARYIALAKALEKLGKRKQAIEALENAYSFDPNISVLRHMLEFYENINDEENIEKVKARIAELQESSAKPKRTSRKTVKTKATRSTKKAATESKTIKRPKTATAIPVSGDKNKRTTLSKSRKIS